MMQIAYFSGNATPCTLKKQRACILRSKFPRIPYTGSPVSENFSSRNCPKRVQGTLLAWIWPVHGGQNGPRSPVSVARKASFQAHPRLFGQFLEEKFSETQEGTRAKEEVRGFYAPAPYLSPLAQAIA